MSIESLREEIDKIDDKILELFIKRMCIRNKICEIKKANGINLRDLNREKEIIDRVKKAAGQYAPAAESLFKFIVGLPLWSGCEVYSLGAGSWRTGKGEGQSSIEETFLV